MGLVSARSGRKGGGPLDEGARQVGCALPADRGRPARRPLRYRARSEAVSPFARQRRHSSPTAS